MNVKAYVPNIEQIIKVAVVIAIIGLLFKYLPIPESIKALFRI